MKPPIFVRLLDGALLAYDAPTELEDDLLVDDFDGVDVWDADGVRLNIVKAGQAKISIDSTFRDAAAFAGVLREGLRERRVKGVDGMTLEELADKASIRFTAKRINAPWWAELLTWALQLGGGRPS